MNHFTTAPGPRRVFSLLWAIALLWAALAIRPAFAQSATIDANAKVHITVANEPQLTGDYDVDAAGNITMLYINQVHVQGLTQAQAASVISKGLEKYYTSPQVVVQISDRGGIGVDVTGLVSNPRHYVLRSGAHLNDLMQQAVPALNADLSQVTITHSSDSAAKSTVNYRSFLDKQDAGGNPVLLDGDTINVAAAGGVPITVNVQGQVAKPGRFEVPAGTTVSSALQSAGGPTLNANQTGISFRHFGTTNEIPFNLTTASQNPTDQTADPVLQDGDTITVPAAPIAQTYTITGPGVRNPAEYPLTSPTISLAQAIGRAGGLSDRAKIDQVQIIRTDAVTHATQTIKLNATDPTVQGNYQVQAGDNITIGQGGPPNKFDPLQGVGILIAIFGIFHH